MELNYNNIDNCNMISGISIRWNNKTNKIVFEKCCIQRYIKQLSEISLDEFLQINDIYTYLNDLSTKFDDTLCHLHNFNCNRYVKKLDTIYISISKACGLKCPMCFVGSNHTDTTLRKNAYFSVLNKLKGLSLNKLYLTDNGDPLYYFDETVSYLKSLTKKNDFKTVSLITTLQGLDKVKINKLANIKNINLEVIVDYDSNNELTYEKIRLGGSFKLFKDNLNYILNNTTIKIPYFMRTVSKLNKDESDDYLKEYSISYINNYYWKPNMDFYEDS